MNRLLLSLCSLCMVLLLFQCENETVPEPMVECEESITYIGTVETVIQNSCAYAGCHVQGTPGISDYSTYDGLIGAIESGAFQNRVLETMTMPPSNAPGPSELSQENIDLLRCWIEKGYPQ